MKETLKIAAVVVVTGGLVTLAAVRHKNAVHVAPAPNQAQVQLTAANKHIADLESQVTSVTNAAAATKSDLCTFIAQHKITPTPTDCQ